MLWNIIVWLFIGLVVGLLARLVIPGKQNIGWLPTILIGIVGALIGGFLSAQVFKIDDNGGIEWLPLIISVICGALCVAGYTRIAAKQGSGRAS